MIPSVIPTVPTLFGGITLPGAPDLANIRKLDMLPMPMISRMQRLGTCIDPPYFNDLTSDLTHDMDRLKSEIACEIPIDNLDQFVALSGELEDSFDPINVESGAQLAKLLFDVLNVGKGKDLKRTNSGDRISTGKKQLQLIKKDHPVVQLILDYRERSKLVNTYTSKLPRIAKFHPRGKDCPICELTHGAATYRVHTEFTSTRTGTGRFASKNPNLQNIPAKTELGRKVRAGFIASPGTVLVGRDFSQIELRMLAHCAEEAEMIRIFSTGGDIHVDTACRAFSLRPDQIDKLLHRAPCKNINFAVVYGLTKDGLYDQMALTYAVAGVPLPAEITIEWCGEFIDLWFDLYPSVHPYMDLQYFRARRYGIVWDLFGRVRRVPEVQSVHSWIKSAGLRQAGNLPIQAVAAELMKLAMAEIETYLTVFLKDHMTDIWCWPLLTIHDELIVEVEEDHADLVDGMMAGVMDNVLTDRKTGRNLCRVPILSDGKVMTRWVKE